MSVTRNVEPNMVCFQGPYVHGTPTAPFLYLSLKRVGVEYLSWIRRLKIPLPNFAWDQIEAASGTTTFAARVSGAGSGTVPLLDGEWTRQDHHSVL